MCLLTGLLVLMFGLAAMASFAAAGMQAEYDYLQLVRRYYIDHDYAAVVQAIVGIIVATAIITIICNVLEV